MPGVYFNHQNFSQVQFNFAYRAASKLLELVNDSRFLERVRLGRYTGRKFRLDDRRIRYIQADNDRILYQIVNGKEWGKAPDGNINLLLRLGPARGIGYVNPPNPLITTDPDFFNRCMNKNRPVSLASHWMHEWMHVSGFRHASSDPDFNDVVYKVGDHLRAVARLRAKEQGETDFYINTIAEEYIETLIGHGNTVGPDFDF